jgi:CubicO group peptidase (beta-lactamase class C family)
MMRQRMRFWAGLGGLLLVMTESAAAPTLDQQLAAIANDGAHPMASLSVLAIRDGKLAYQQQFGRRHIGPPADLPVTADTLFRIASISKMMTTFGLMKLVEQGKLNLDEDVGVYLGFPLRNPHFPARPITLRQLLTHTASLRDAAGYSWGAEVRLSDILVPGAARYGDGAMWASNAGPGAYFTYCNLNWGVIGTIMEKVSGQRFDRLMNTLLLAPLEIEGGYHLAELPAAARGHIATLYRKRTTDTEVWDPDGPWIAQADDAPGQAAAAAGLDHYIVGSNATVFSPTGGLRISAAGLGKIMLMLLNEGKYRDRQILAPRTIQLMFNKQWMLDAGGANGDTDHGLFQIWGLGNQQFSASIAPARDGGNGLVAGGDFDAAGHLGDAYGLLSAFVVDFHNRNGMVTLIGGTGTDPALYPGIYSPLSRFEENVLTTLYRGAIAGSPAAPK